MTEHEQAAKVAKTHTIYRLEDGTRVPGTTTITGVMDKPALVKWANGLGLKGIDSTKYVDELATIGTLAHYMIECHCRNMKPDLGNYTPNQIGLAENSYIKWMYWADSVGFVPIHNELILVSEKYRFGGTLDVVGKLAKRNNITALVDVKTCRAIYGEAKTQVAGGYKILAMENGIDLGATLITRVGRSEDEGFEEINISDYECTLHQKRFLICRELYDINAQINKK